MTENITVELDIDITPYLPEKSNPYVAYCSERKEFYVSTIDDDRYEDKYNGYITMNDIVDLFIENYECGKGGNIRSKDANPFIKDLKDAIDRVKIRLDT